MALEFDGVNERIDYPNVFDPVGGPLTVACRWNPLGNPDQSEYVLLIENGASDFGFIAWLQDEGGGLKQLKISVWTSDGGSGALNCFGEANKSFLLDTWYDLIFTWDGSLTASNSHIYLNNVEETYAVLTNGTGTIRQQNGNWIIGGRTTDNLRNLQGRLADVGVWNAVLTPGERAAYSAGLPPANVRSENLQFDARYIGGNTTDSVTLLAGVVNGTPVSYDHPTHILSVDQTGLAVSQLASITNDSPATNNRSTTSSTVSLAPSQLALASVDQIDVFDRFEGGNTDVGRTVISNPASDTPTITLYARPNVRTEAVGLRYYSMACRLSGMNGKTPTIRLNLDDSDPHSIYGNAGWPSGWRPWFTYDSPPFTVSTNWQRMANSLPVGNFQEVSHSSAFTQDTVHFTTKPPYTPSMVRAHIDSIKSNPLVSEPSSSISFGGNEYTYGQSAATTRDGDSWPVPALDLICFRISSDLTGPINGTPKRKAVLISGQHASEDQGNWQLQAFVDYLLSGVATANALVRDWEFFVYPMVNTSGRWGSAYRGTLQAGEIDEDPNRDWPGGVTAGLLHVVTTTRLAIAQDTGNALNAFLDFHGSLNEADAVYRVQSAVNTNYVNNVNAIYAIAIQDQISAKGLADKYYQETFGVRLSVTPEGATFTPAISNYALFGEALAQALNDSFLAGDFPAVAAPNATVASIPTQLFEASQTARNRRSRLAIFLW